MTPKEYARRAFDEIVKKTIQPGGIVPLAEYGSLADYETCIPFEAGNSVSWYERRHRTTELAELIEIEGGCTPIFIQINPTEYFQWLEKRENTERTRAAYIGWIAAGRPENYNAISGKMSL